MCIVAAAVWGVCLILRPNPAWEPTWPWFVFWLFCAALTGAVWEWQVPDEEDDQSPAGGSDA